MLFWMMPLGCAVDYGISDEIAEDAGAPVLGMATRLTLEAPLEERVEGSLHIRNTGSAELILQDAWIDGDDFTLLDLPETLAPEAEGTITLAFAPTALTASGVLTLYSNDPDRSEMLAELIGVGLIPKLEIVPDPVEFDGVLIGCTDTEVLTLQNHGDAPLYVEEINISTEGITVDAEDPLTISPGAFQVISLTFTPTDNRVYLGEISVLSNDPAGTQTVTARGEGSLGAAVEERFRQGGGSRNAVDMMFYVDQSCSMSEEQQYLGDEALDMLEALQETGVDYQVMVITESDGCHSGEIITEETGNAEDIFVDALYGNDNSYTEAGLTLTRAALEASETGGCNDGFLREGITPSIVLISDEPEQSSAGWSSVLEDILAIEERTLISAIAGDYPDGCSTADAGTGYYQATEATGGLYLSICETDWANHIEELVETSANITGDPTDTFSLTEAPVEETLVITVDGIVALSGWSYDAAENAIVFEQMPEPDTVIVVTFSSVCQP